jgi:multidrug transporter EmrE-like cation transporter
MQLVWLSLAIVATVGYHLVLKVTPQTVNPFISLAATYALGATIFLLLFAISPSSPPIREAVRLLNWTSLALATTVVALDVGFLLLYRSGFDVSLGQIVTQSSAALILLVAGVAFFREKLNAANLAGIALCVVGLWLINRK